MFSKGNGSSHVALPLGGNTSTSSSSISNVLVILGIIIIISQSVY
jgi:hypothetical protein